MTDEELRNLAERTAINYAHRQKTDDALSEYILTALQSVQQAEREKHQTTPDAVELAKRFYTAKNSGGRWEHIPEQAKDNYINAMRKAFVAYGAQTKGE